jgi:hypothetical protein
MIFPLGVAFELGFIEIHVSQVAGAVTLRLIVKVR